MKKVVAIIRHFKLEDVNNALTAQGIRGMTISEVRGSGRQRWDKEVNRGTEYPDNFVPKLKVEVVCTDSQLQMVIDTVIQCSRTGAIGDGKLIVTNVEQMIRIRTGESGEEAL